MSAVLLTGLAAFVGTVLLFREAGRLEFRPWPVIGGFLLLVLGSAGFMVAVFRWLAVS